MGIQSIGRNTISFSPRNRLRFIITYALELGHPQETVVSKFLVGNFDAKIGLDVVENFGFDKFVLIMRDKRIKIGYSGGVRDDEFAVRAEWNIAFSYVGIGGAFLS